MISLGLTSKQLQERKGSIGGSDANIIMSGDPERIYRLWSDKRGETEPEDLSGVLPVVMGQWTEELNRLWFSREMGMKVERAGERVTSVDQPFMTATLDGFIEAEAAIIECKHTNPFNFDLADFILKYQPQLQHNMFVAGVQKAYLSYFRGNSSWDMELVFADQFYQDGLIKQEAAFWDSVLSGEPPPTANTRPAPVGPAAVLRTVDMSPVNSWMAGAHDWLSTQGAAQLHDRTTKELRAMVGQDVGKAHGGGVVIKRDKRGALRISKEK